MAAFDKESYKEREERYRTDEIDHGRFSSVAAPDPDDDDLIDDDDDDLDDDTSTIGDDDLDDTTIGDDDLDDLDDDDLEDDDDDDDLIDANRQMITSEEDIESGGEESDPDLTPNETPEGDEAHQETISFPEEGQTEPGGNESSTSWSEQIDVTPPQQHGFPSVGKHTETNFEHRSHGRTTGRIIGDDPGTEGI